MPTREAWDQRSPGGEATESCYRFSPPMIGQRNDSWPNSSMVVLKDATCPAPKQGGKWGDCRACWDPKVKVVKLWQALIPGFGDPKSLSVNLFIREPEAEAWN